MNSKPISELKIALIIFAHDESSIVGNTVKAAKAVLQKEDELFVIADNCRDDTAIIAEKAGARVFVRESPSYGKGAALTWFVKTYAALVTEFDRLIILDADSLISHDFLIRIKAFLDESYPVMQCFVMPSGFESSHISTLIALSELVEQSVFDRIRSYLGWSIRLRGTGMVFSPQLLIDIADRVRTEVEDIALTLLVSEKKIKIKFIASVNIFDPKPVESAAASRQRARWFRGQLNAFWKYRSAILKILLQGPRGWFLISSLFLKPRWLMFGIKLVLALVFLHTPVISLIFCGLIAFDLLLYLIGILQLEERKKFLRAIFYLPRFVLMWLKGMLLSLKGSPWLRVRSTDLDSNNKDTSNQRKIGS